jgi:hypothetical protein
MTAKAVHLLDLYGTEILGAAAREAIARGTHVLTITAERGEVTSRSDQRSARGMVTR